MTPPLNRPEPIFHPDAKPVDRSVLAVQAAARLRDGEHLMITDWYGTGEEILARLEALLPAFPPQAPYEERQVRRRVRREAALRLLVSIEDRKLALRDGRPLSFHQELYPEGGSFALPLVQVQELAGAWNRFRDGVHLAVLGAAVHPFYGTYAPTRTSHLELFATWLHRYTGSRARGVDVGTGCGVLALLLCRAGFGRVLATDLNPNAIESVRRERARFLPPPPIDLACADLFGDDVRPADLIVFNPPWIRGEAEGFLDEALVYDDHLFERFYEQACARLTPEGRVVLIFSNIMSLVQPDAPHPILTELARGRLRQVQKLERKVEPPRAADGTRRRTRERVEVWELARS